MTSSGLPAGREQRAFDFARNQALRAKAAKGLGFSAKLRLLGEGVRRMVATPAQMLRANRGILESPRAKPRESLNQGLCCPPPPFQLLSLEGSGSNLAQETWRPCLLRNLLFYSGCCLIFRLSMLCSSFPVLRVPAASACLWLSAGSCFCFSASLLVCFACLILRLSAFPLFFLTAACGRCFRFMVTRNRQITGRV